MTLLEERIDPISETKHMLRGLNEKDLNAFLLLLEQSEQQRKRRAVERWSTFNT
jgi:hypothetical protein